MKTIIMPVIAASLALTLSSPAGAQPIVNRAAVALAVLPEAGGTSAPTEVHVAWTAALGGSSSAPLDLSTELVLLVNGEAQASLSVSVLADPGGGFCGAGGCGGGCGTGYLDGVFNTLLCLPDGEGPFAGCECRFPSILGSFPLPQPLEPGDEIEVLLISAPGAVPDADTSDDRLVRTYQGAAIGWDRVLSDVTVTPSAEGGDSFFDIFVEVGIATSGIEGAIDVTPAVELWRNGALDGTFSFPCGPWYAAPLGTCQVCSGILCGTITCNGQIVAQMTCTQDGSLLGCGCHAMSVGSLVVPGVLLEPGDDVVVLLVPAPGALPELPPLEPDDEEPVEPVGTWVDLGRALAGTHGTPVTVGAGTLVGGDPVALTLTQALESSTAFLVAGLAFLGAPFKGGVLVPDPTSPGAFFALPTGPVGTIGLAGTWPAGLPSSFATYYQWWIIDSQGPLGYAASNGLVATTP